MARERGTDHKELADIEKTGRLALESQRADVSAVGMGEDRLSVTPQLQRVPLYSYYERVDQAHEWRADIPVVRRVKFLERNVSHGARRN